MTKTKATLSTDTIGASTKIEVVSAEKPQCLWLVGPTGPTLAKAAALIRQGYVFDSTMPIEMFAEAGTMSFHLSLGSPEQYVLEEVELITTQAMELQHNAHAKEVEAAAARLIEERERAAKQCAIQAEIDEKKKALRQLQASLASA